MKNIFIKTLLFIAILCGYFALAPWAQVAKRNAALIQQIDSMFASDQFWRIEYTKKERREISIYSYEGIRKNWSEVDRINQLKAKLIIKKYGYPGYDLVGSSSDSFWIIIQHCDNDIPFQERVLALMKQQIAKNNASKEKYAYLTDRILVNKDQKQIYGTQLSRDNKTGKYSPFPLKDPKSVDKLRKEVGLEPIAIYINNFE